MACSGKNVNSSKFEFRIEAGLKRLLDGMWVWVFVSFIVTQRVLTGVMRIILTARTTLVPMHQTLLKRFIGILGAIAKNPSNPNFDQYIFESISALIRCVVIKVFWSPGWTCRQVYRCRITRVTFGFREESFRTIHNRLTARHWPQVLISWLSHPIRLLTVTTEFIPYVFQIISQMLRLMA